MIIEFKNPYLSYLTRQNINVSKCYNFYLSSYVEKAILINVGEFIGQNILTEIYISVKNRFR